MFKVFQKCVIKLQIECKAESLRLVHLVNALATSGNEVVPQKSESKDSECLCFSRKL